jgi:CRP/FNR family nitrogen fixation transcriptional regulator
MAGRAQIAERHQAARWRPPLLSRSLPPPAGGLDLLEHIATVLVVRREQEIYCQDSPADHYYRVMSGSVRTVKLLADGRRQVSAFLLPGDLFGFEALATHDFAAEALQDSLVARYPRRAVEALAQRSVQLSQLLCALATARLRQAHDRMLLLGCMTAPERISTFLLQMSDRAPPSAEGRFELAMSRRDIADFLGLTIETVSRTLTALRRDGTIGIARRIRIEIRDRQALQSLIGALRP